VCCESVCVDVATVMTSYWRIKH